MGESSSAQFSLSSSQATRRHADATGRRFAQALEMHEIGATRIRRYAEDSLEAKSQESRTHPGLLWKPPRPATSSRLPAAGTKPGPPRARGSGRAHPDPLEKKAIAP